MVDQRTQHGRGRRTAERADKGPVVVAGMSLPAAVARRDSCGVVEKMRRPGEHYPAPASSAVIARSEATKQTILPCGTMDCFAALAMTRASRNIAAQAAKYNDVGGKGSCGV